jgi:hypothetical protein
MKYWSQSLLFTFKLSPLHLGPFLSFRGEYRLFDAFQPARGSQDDWLMAFVTFVIQPLFFALPLDVGYSRWDTDTEDVEYSSLDYAGAKWTLGRLKSAAACFVSVALGFASFLMIFAARNACGGRWRSAAMWSLIAWD